MKKKLGIYIHIPFCVRKCAYCDFLSAPADETTRAAYVRALKEEIRSAGDLNETYEGATVFFGGGTPSLLAGEELAGILDEVSRRLLLRPDAEITVECNPGTLNRKKLENYKAAGVNRLSIGLQSADNRELKILGRIHTWEQFRENYALVRELGFSNVNIDLMSALPGQTREDWLSTLQKVTALDPEHISAYSLIIEEGTPFYESYRAGKLELVSEEMDREMYHWTVDTLAEWGYGQYEISNFAKVGRQSRHNRIYWQAEEYLGMGLGAHSYMDGKRFHNSYDLQKYISAKGDTSLLREDTELITETDALAEFMFLGLRLTEGVSFVRFRQRFGKEMDTVYGKELQELAELGLLLRDESGVRLSRRGIDVSNAVFERFLL